MSAIGACARIKQQQLNHCVFLASQIKTVTQGRWLFKRTVDVGRSEFHNAWKDAVLEQEAFDLSGYVLSDYFVAQAAVNNMATSPFDSDDALSLSNAFTAAFAVRSRATRYPDLPDASLLRFCSDEYGPDAADMFTAIRAAELFYAKGIARIEQDEAVVFLII